MDSDFCWHKDPLPAEDCSFRHPELETGCNRKQRFLHRCLECPRFLADLEDLKNQDDRILSLTPLVVEEIVSLRAQVQALSSLAESRAQEIKFLHEVSLVLQTSVDMDEVLAMALTAVTAGKGFGLNRAILLLVDREEENLKGYFAVGPRNLEEAAQIWREIADHDYSLREMAQLFFRQRMAREKEKFKDLLALLSTPLSHDQHLFVETLNQQVSRHVPNLALEPSIDPVQARALGIEEMVLVPLVSKNRRIGLLLADNIVNGKPISATDLRSLETFTLPVSFAIERAALYERLQEEVDKLTQANQRLKDQQELILRMEKMALVGKLASNIAHSIRNPLTIIGGFARTLLKQTPADDARRGHIDSIVREARRLEGVLEEVLNYSESLHPTFDLWDVNQLVTEVCAGLKDDLRLNHVDCRLETGRELPQLRLDFKKLSYCLRNIIHHAVTAMPEGGQLDIRTVRVGEEVHIILSDTGRGENLEAMEAASAPLFPSPQEGNCLGLSLCARILKDHGAAFQMHSNEGAGSTFTIRLTIPKEADSYGSALSH